MHAQTYRVNRPDVIDEHFDNEYVVVNLRTGTYYSLNHTAASIWDLLDKTVSTTEILAQMQLRYADNTGQIAADLDDLLTEMIKEGLIVPRTDSTASAAAALTPNPQTRLDYIVPRLEKFTDMQALLLLDPIHQVDESGWPTTRADAN